MFNHFKTNAAVRLPVRLLDSSFAAVTGVAQGSTTVAILFPGGTSSSLVAGTNYTWTEISTGAFSGKGLYILEITQATLNGTGEYTVAINGGSGSAVAEFSCYSELPADVYTRVGAPAGASVSADIAAVKVDTGAISTVNTKLGTPAGVSVSADIAAVKSDTSVAASQSTTAATQATTAATNTGTINTKLGSPAGVSVSADIAALQTDIDTNNTDTALVKKYLEGTWHIYTSGLDANRLVIFDTDGITPLIKFDLKDSVGAATTTNPFRRIKVP